MLFMPGLKQKLSVIRLIILYYSHLASFSFCQCQKERDRGKERQKNNREEGNTVKKESQKQKLYNCAYPNAKWINKPVRGK